MKGMKSKEHGAEGVGKETRGRETGDQERSEQ